MKEVVASIGTFILLLGVIQSLNMMGLPLAVDPKVLARGTPGFSGAELQNMVK